MFDAIVEQSLFGRANAIIAARSARLSDDEMLAALEKLLKKAGSLSGLIIDEEADCPSSSAYSTRFGSLLRAYQLIGYTPERDYSYIEINKHLRAMHPEVVRDTIAKIEGLGADVRSDENTGLLWINREFSLSIVIVRCKTTGAGNLRWHLRFDRGLEPDISVAVRLNPDNLSIRDYFILPTREIDGTAIRTAEFNGFMLDAFLSDSLEPLFALADRCPIKEVA